MKLFRKTIKLYYYLVYYHFKGGYGSCTISCSEKIDTVDRLMKIKKDIEEDNKFENVGIASYQLIEIKKMKEVV